MQIQEHYPNVWYFCKYASISNIFFGGGGDNAQNKKYLISIFIIIVFENNNLTLRQFFEIYDTYLCSHITGFAITGNHCYSQEIMYSKCHYQIYYCIHFIKRKMMPKSKILPRNLESYFSIKFKFNIMRLKSSYTVLSGRHNYSRARWRKKMYLQSWSLQ